MRPVNLVRDTGDWPVADMHNLGHVFLALFPITLVITCFYLQWSITFAQWTIPHRSLYNCAEKGDRRKNTFLQKCNYGEEVYQSRSVEERADGKEGGVQQAIQKYRNGKEGEKAGLRFKS